MERSEAMIDLTNIKTYPISKRGNKSETSEFSTPKPNAKMSEIMPEILAGGQFKEMIKRLANAAKNKKPIIVMMGGHVIKCGLAPLIIDLMKRGIITHVAMNGAASIHDFEIAYQAATSEDVAKGLKDGSFGMVEETGKYMNEAINKAYKTDLGQGQALGFAIKKMNLANKHYSILAAGAELHIPVTVHVAIGTDIIHQHPLCNGAATGETTFRDFKTLAQSISNLEGGAVLNLGSAVIMPEVFLKALTIARNLGATVNDFTAVNFDMYSQYRANVNVVQRPTMNGGKGYSFIGQHEILIPLLYSMLLEELGETQ